MFRIGSLLISQQCKPKEALTANLVFFLPYPDTKSGLLRFQTKPRAEVIGIQLMTE